MLILLIKINKFIYALTVPIFCIIYFLKYVKKNLLLFFIVTVPTFILRRSVTTS